MTGNDQKMPSRSGRWLRRTLTKTKDVESQQSSRLNSISCVDNAQSAPYQILYAEPGISQVFEEVSPDLGIHPSGLAAPSLAPSPDVPQAPCGLQQQSHPEVTLLHPSRPVLPTRNSSVYFTPCDIYAADPNIHSDSIYSNDDAAYSRSSLASSTPSVFQYLKTLPTSTPKRSGTYNPWTLVKAGWHKFTSVFNPQCFWKMIDMREIFFPFTWKRYITLAIIALIIGGLVATELFFHWMTAAMAITRSNMLPVLVLVLALEPSMIVIILIFAKIPDLDSSNVPTTKTEKVSDIEAQNGILSNVVTPAADHRTALVVPCYNSDHDAVLRVLASAYPHFRPRDIFIVDNARSMHPKDNVFREFIHSQHEEINYIWSTVGSKNYAQLVGAVAAEHHEFIMTVDDDVCIPASFRPPIHKINDVMKGPTFWGAITIPLYKQLYYFVSVIGAIRALVFYIGGHKLPLTAKQMIEAGDERVLWLDPRWATNKAFIADEGVALRSAKEGANDCAAAKTETDTKTTSVIINEKEMLPSLITPWPEMYDLGRDRIN
ncbi:hypothetical protein Q7P35_001142 [Cladosporium inversicolor]